MLVRRQKSHKSVVMIKNQNPIIRKVIVYKVKVFCLEIFLIVAIITKTHSCLKKVSWKQFLKKNL